VLPSETTVLPLNLNAQIMLVCPGVYYTYFNHKFWLAHAGQQTSSQRPGPISNSCAEEYYTGGPNNGSNYDGQRIHVIKASSTDLWASTWSYADVWSIDPSVLKLNGNNYMIYSTQDSNAQCLFIAFIMQILSLLASAMDPGKKYVVVFTAADSPLRYTMAQPVEWNSD
ncbi:10312_t:CDS:2, partial [Acaulospora colombiana]